MRIWAREFKNLKMLRDTTITDNSDDTRTHKVMNALETACREFDIQVPIWLDINVKDFKLTAKTRFNKDSFIEDVPFDYLELRVIEED